MSKREIESCQMSRRDDYSMLGYYYNGDRPLPSIRYMNARSKEYKLNLDARQIPDAVGCIFHSLLLHRCTGKFNYNTETNFSIGSIGVKEEECSFIDLSYVRVNSDDLAARVAEEVRAFEQDVSHRRALIRKDAPCLARIGLEFSVRKSKGGWKVFASSAEELTPWELWYLHLTVTTASDEDELSGLRETAAEAVSDIVLSICSSINRTQYLPKAPNRVDINSVFDTRFAEAQPFLFRIMRPQDNAQASGAGVASTMKKLFRDTLMI